MRVTVNQLKRFEECSELRSRGLTCLCFSFNKGTKDESFFFLVSPSPAGCEVEGTGSVCDVPFPDEEQGMDADPNQQLHLPEPVL